MKSISLFVLSLLCAVTTCLGQKNFEPATVTLNSGEVIKGFIDNRKWSRNPSDISFRETESGVIQTYLVKDLKGFTINTNERYVRMSVSVDNNSVNFNTVTSYDPALIAREIVWLRQLVSGPLLNIYEYNTNRFHFYMQQEDSVVYELIYKVDASVTPAQIIYVFRSQLLAALPEKAISSKTKFVISRAEYSEESFFRIGKAVNGDQASDKVGGDHQRQPARYFIGAGIRLGSFTFNSNDPKLNSIDFSNSSVTPVIAGGVDLLPLRGINGLVMRGEIALNQISLKGKGVTKSSVNTYNNEYSLKQFRIMPSLLVYYNVINSDAVRINLGVGAGINLSLTSKNEFASKNETAVAIIKDYPTVRDIWFAEYARIGIILAEHVEVSGLFQFAGSPYAVAQINNKEKPIFLRVAYIF